MSLRYTGEATMEVPALREVERWKDRIEVRLDNRQVFFLFFGSAMVACMLFVLGVIVGKRLESRGRAEASSTDDPLAVLDRLGTQPTAPGGPGPVAPTAAPVHPALTFPRTLLGGSNVAGRGKLAGKLSAAGTGTNREERTAPSARVALVARPVLTATGPVGPSRVVVAVNELPAPAPAPAPAPVPARAEIAPRPASVGKPPARVAASGQGAIGAKPPAASVAPAASAGTTEGKPRGHFLLQLGTFQDQLAAEDFARRFAGRNASVATTVLPGKGTSYRVRLGDFATLQEASVAKTAFEREHNIIAYVAGTGPAR